MYFFKNYKEDLFLVNNNGSKPKSKLLTSVFQTDFGGVMISG